MWNKIRADKIQNLHNDQPSVHVYFIFIFFVLIFFNCCLELCDKCAPKRVSSAFTEDFLRQRRLMSKTHISSTF